MKQYKTVELNVYGKSIIVRNDGKLFWKENEQEIPQFLNAKTGYYNIRFLDKGSGLMRNVLVHRIVCQAFHPIDNAEGMCVDHIDNNRTRNCQSNLRWVTKKFNNSRKHAKMMKSKNYSTKTHPDQFVKATNKQTGEVRFFKNGTRAAKELNLDSSPIHRVLAGQGFSVHGWLFVYVDRSLPECDKLNKQLLEEKLSKVTPCMKRTLEIRQKSRERRRKINALAPISRSGEKSIKNFRRLARVVVQLDLDGKTPIREWENIYAAEKEFHVNDIRQVLFGLKDSTGGFKWAWKIEV